MLLLHKLLFCVELFLVEVWLGSSSTMVIIVFSDFVGGKSDSCGGRRIVSPPIVVHYAGSIDGLLALRMTLTFIA